MELSITEYLNDRLENQINWYDKKSSAAQRKYKGIKITEIILAASIPILASFSDNHWILSLVIGVIGASIAVLEGILGIGKYHENWIEYRSVCETLRHEKYMYLTQTGIYESEGKFKMLVERVESVISKENVNWANLHNNKEAKS